MAVQPLRKPDNLSNTGVERSDKPQILAIHYFKHRSWPGWERCHDGPSQNAVTNFLLRRTLVDVAWTIRRGVGGLKIHKTLIWLTAA
jgi:hypothetical protein